MLPIDLSKKMKIFSQKNPDIHLQIDEIEERDIEHHFLENQYHIYILRGIYKQLSHYSHITLYKDSMICVLSREHPLSKKHMLSLDDLKSEELLLPPQYTTITKLAIQSCLDHGFVPHIKKYGRIETILSSVCENEGIALLMKKSLHIFHLKNVKIIELKETIYGDTYLYYPSNQQNNAIQKFVDFMK